MAEEVIATIPKNATEEYRISITEFNGYDLATIRVWFKASGGDMRPGKQGVSVRVEKLPELIESLQETEARARAEGLMEAREAVGA